MKILEKKYTIWMWYGDDWHGGYIPYHADTVQECIDYLRKEETNLDSDFYENADDYYITQRVNLKMEDYDTSEL